MKVFNRLNYFILFFCFLSISSTIYSQNNETQIPEEEEKVKIPDKVGVKPNSQDEEIKTRLQGILQATQWFTDLKITVNEGVVFIEGETKKDDYKTWATELASRTEDVVAVVNHLNVKPSIWDYSEAMESLRALWSRLVQSLPSIIFGILILIASWIFARLATLFVRLLIRKRLNHDVLVKLISRTIGTLVFIVGMYVFFEVAGLSALAFTIVGGTGVVGIILGIAFRDITENILASIILSIHHPFHKNDLIEVEGVMGYVQYLTMRATVLTSFEGYSIQIPNATVYKGTINNYTLDPKKRECFSVGISFKEDIHRAQKIALKVIDEHPDTLDYPQPWAFVHDLGKSTVNLKIYFWVNIHEHNWLHVRSGIIEGVLAAFNQNGILFPDEGRERLFPQTLTVDLNTHSRKSL